MPNIEVKRGKVIITPSNGVNVYELQSTPGGLQVGHQIPYGYRTIKSCLQEHRWYQKCVILDKSHYTVLDYDGTKLEDDGILTVRADAHGEPQYHYWYENDNETPEHTRRIIANLMAYYEHRRKPTMTAEQKQQLADLATQKKELWQQRIEAKALWERLNIDIDNIDLQLAKVKAEAKYVTLAPAIEYLRQNFALIRSYVDNNGYTEFYKIGENTTVCWQKEWLGIKVAPSLRYEDAKFVNGRIEKCL
jgi:hypothetical protein